jgi:hypothetical protein
MTRKIGIWLDRSKAIIVRVNEKKCETEILMSDFHEARHPRCGTEGHCTLIPEKRIAQRKQEIVNKFYHSIVDKITDAGMILSLGRGMAKVEFANELKTIKQLRSRIVGVETAERMSPRQTELKISMLFNSIVNQPSVRRPMACNMNG